MENNTKSFYHSLAHQVLNSILLLDNITMEVDGKLRAVMALLEPEEEEDMLFWVEQAQGYIREARTAMEDIIGKYDV